MWSRAESGDLTLVPAGQTDNCSHQMAGDPWTAAAVHRLHAHTHKVTLEMGATVVVSAGCRQSMQIQLSLQSERSVTAGCRFKGLFALSSVNSNVRCPLKSLFSYYVH